MTRLYGFCLGPLPNRSIHGARSRRSRAGFRPALGFISEFDIMSDMARWIGAGLARTFARLEERFRWRPFSSGEAARELGFPPARTALLLSRLARAGWLVRVGRGAYVALDARWACATEGDPFAPYAGSPFLPVLASSVAGALQLYGGRLRALALFGSCARGDARPESDVDLLAVVEPLPDRLGDRLAEIEPVAGDGRRLAAEGSRAGRGFHGPQFVLLTPTELRREPPLLLDLSQEADLLFDPDHVLREALGRLREKLSRHGAQRISLGDGLTFWRLHPGARLGEIREL